MVRGQVVIIMDLDRLREFAQGPPLPAELPEPIIQSERTLAEDRMIEEERGT
jgi:hypothetical protein